MASFLTMALSVGTTLSFFPTGSATYRSETTLQTASSRAEYSSLATGNISDILIRSSQSTLEPTATSLPLDAEPASTGGVAKVTITVSGGILQVKRPMLGILKRNENDTTEVNATTLTSATIPVPSPTSLSTASVTFPEWFEEYLKTRSVPGFNAPARAHRPGEGLWSRAYISTPSTSSFQIPTPSPTSDIVEPNARVLATRLVADPLIRVNASSIANALTRTRLSVTAQLEPSKWTLQNAGVASTSSSGSVLETPKPVGYIPRAHAVAFGLWRRSTTEPDNTTSVDREPRAHRAAPTLLRRHKNDFGRIEKNYESSTDQIPLTTDRSEPATVPTSTTLANPTVLESTVTLNEAPLAEYTSTDPDEPIVHRPAASLWRRSTDDTIAVDSASASWAHEYIAATLGQGLATTSEVALASASMPIGPMAHRGADGLWRQTTNTMTAAEELMVLPTSTRRILAPTYDPGSEVGLKQHRPVANLWDRSEPPTSTPLPSSSNSRIRLMAKRPAAYLKLGTATRVEPTTTSVWMGWPTLRRL